MFCDKCGQELMDGDLFCPHCGHKVEKIEPASFFNVVKDSGDSDYGADPYRDDRGGGYSSDPYRGDTGGGYSSDPYRGDTGGGYSSDPYRGDTGGGYSSDPYRDDRGGGYGADPYRDDRGGGYGADPYRDDRGSGYGADPYRDDRGGGYGTDPNSDIYSKAGINEDKQSFDKYVEMAAGGIGLAWVLVLLMSLLTRIFVLLSNALYYVYPLHGLLGGLVTALSFITQAISWLAIIAGAAVAGGLVYKLTQKKPGESNQMLLVGIIDAAIVMLVGIIYRLSYSGAFYASGFYMMARAVVIIGGIASVVLGADLFIKVFIEKDGLGGSFNLADDIEFIKSKFAKADTSDTSHYTDTNIPHYETTVEHEPGDSYFDGAGVDLFVKRLLLFLISLVTCGLGTPFMLANIEKWKKEHTVIEGRRLIFNGTGTQLFIKYVIWVLLTIVTFGIYGLFIQTEYCKWMLKHTAYEGMVPINEEYPESFFDGTVGESIGNQILNYLITSFTCGLGLPWGHTMIYRWEKKGSVISRDRLFYDGDGSGMFKEYIIVWLLTLVTCGIYSPWGEVRIEKYVINHTHVDSRWKL